MVIVALILPGAQPGQVDLRDGEALLRGLPGDRRGILLEIVVDLLQVPRALRVGCAADLGESPTTTVHERGYQGRIRGEPGPLEESAQGWPIVLWLLDVEAEEGDLVLGFAVGAVPLARPLNHVADLGALPDAEQSLQSILGGSIAALDIGGP